MGHRGSRPNPLRQWHLPTGSSAKFASIKRALGQLDRDSCSWCLGTDPVGQSNILNDKWFAWTLCSLRQSCVLQDKAIIAESAAHQCNEGAIGCLRPKEDVGGASKLDISLSHPERMQHSSNLASCCLFFASADCHRRAENIANSFVTSVCTKRDGILHM
jgi:hypothetical protein